MKASWDEKLLGDVLKLEYGKPLDQADRNAEGHYPVFGANGEINRSDKFYVNKPSIIVGRKGSAGEINLSDVKFWPLDVTYFVTFDDQLYDLRFLYYLLVTLELPRLSKGVKPGINRNEVYSLSAKFPPLPEQQRIVHLLDEAFDRIATAIANAEKNLVNTRVLFESVLQGLYESAGKGWEEMKLGDIASEMQTGPFGSMLHKSDYVANGIPVVNPQNIVDGEITPLQKMMVSKKTKERLSRFILQEKDIVLARRGEMGRCALVEKEQVGWLCGSGSFVIRIQKGVNANYLVRYLSSAKVKRILQKGSVGTTMDNLNQSILAQIPVPFPPLAEQRAIITKLDTLREETRRLESIYQSKLASLDELKKSLLHHAFNGEL